MTFRQHNILGLCTRKAGQALVPHSIPQPQSLSHSDVLGESAEEDRLQRDSTFCSEECLFD